MCRREAAVAAVVVVYDFNQDIHSLAFRENVNAVSNWSARWKTAAEKLISDCVSFSQRPSVWGAIHSLPTIDERTHHLVEGNCCRDDCCCLFGSKN